MADSHTELVQRLTRPLDLIRYASSRFAAAELHFGHGTANALDEACALVLGALHLPPDLPDVFLNGALSSAETRAVLALIERRVEEQLPVAYLLGRCWYAGQEFRVSPDTLIPRSPIFELIENGFSPWLELEPERVLDLCTGSGCLAILLAQAFPGVPVDGADLSQAALDIAQSNVQRFGLSEQIELLQGDGLQACAGRRYDLIVSNPPYVPSAEYLGLPAEYKHEPRLGLESGADGLDFVRGLLAQAAQFLNPGGLLVCEVGSAAGFLIDAYPDLPFTWAEFSRGGDGVFLLSREDLASIQEES